MRHIRFRRPRRALRRGGLGRGVVLSVFLGLGLAALFIAWLNSRMTPMLLPLAEAKVRNEITAAVSRRVEATLANGEVSYRDMVTVEKDAGGRIIALTSNTASLNALRSAVMAGVLADVETLSQESIPIPVGNLTGVDLFSDRGPAIQVGLLTTGIAGGEFRNTFTDAGVNQTLHRVELEVSVTVTVLLPSGPVERVVSTCVPVAETVIVGEVPQQYISIGTGDT